MAKKMTLSGYLAQRGTKAKALTKGEAALLGIPYPLQAGWPRRYGSVEIDDDLLVKLVACAEVARLVADQKAARTQAEVPFATLQRSSPCADISLTAKMVCGFVLRKARRFRASPSPERKKAPKTGLVPYKRV